MKKPFSHPLRVIALSSTLLYAYTPAMADTFPLNPGSDLVGELRITIAKHEDTLSDLARRHDLGYNEIVAANPTVDPWLPGEGTVIVLPTQFILPDAPRQGIVLNIATMRLFYFPPAKPGEQAVVVTHPIGIGKEGWSTPLGTTQVIGKQKDPTWIVPASIREEHAKKGDPLPAVVPPGPDNPLGQFAMRLGLPSYLIHGTNKPFGIGMRVSHGCIHLYPEDIAQLFETIPIGVAVNIINKPYTAGWHNNTLYIEAHTPLEEEIKILDGSLTPAVKEVIRATKAEDRTNINWSRLIRVAQHHPGFPIPISTNAPPLSDLFAALPMMDDSSAVPTSTAITEASDNSGQAKANPATATPLPTPQTVSITSAPPESTHWYIQVGNFKNKDNAQRLTTQLRDMTPAITAEAQYISTSTGHRVLVGPFSNKDEAQGSQSRIQTQFGIKTLMKPIASRRTSTN